jgi:hypothetical protein
LLALIALLGVAATGTPVLSSINPDSITVGSSSFILTATGSNFTSNCKIQWEGAELATNFTSATSLNTTITAGYVASLGTRNVSVANTTSSEASENLTFTIENPAPTLTDLTPSTKVVGAAGFNLTLTGTHFLATSKVQWNGTEKTTYYISSTTLNATIPASDLTTAGNRNVRVYNPGPGGGNSSYLTFTIQNPTIIGPPSLTSINPNATTRGGSSFILTATGSNFTSDCKIRWDGTGLTTTYLSSTSLNAVIQQSFITSAGIKNVAVVNTSSLEASGNLTFTIRNPQPTLTDLTPSSKNVGTAEFNLLVTGTNFLATSKVMWEGTERNTTYINATSLNVTILQSDLAIAGKKNVTVFNPIPGGGTSSPLPFTIKNLAPVIRSLSPVSVVAGRGTFVLIATGNRFLPGSKVQWNGKPKTTTYNSATKLKADIQATDVARAGRYEVRVFNPGPGGGFSRNITYLVKNARPDISSISPVNVTAGGSRFVLRVTGSKFVRGCVIRWNGDTRDTTYLSTTRLRSTIPSTDIQTHKHVPITVFNPAPGGGTSNSITLTVV